MSVIEKAAEAQRAKAPNQGHFGVDGVLRMVISRALTNCGIDPSDKVDDIAQEVYLDIIKQGSYDPSKAGLGKYAGTIASRKAWQFQQKKLAQRSFTLSAYAGEDGEPLELPSPAPDALPSFCADTRRAWASLMRELEEARRDFPKLALRATVAFGGRIRAAKALSKGRETPITVSDINEGIRVALSYPSGRDLVSIWTELSEERNRHGEP